MKGVLAQTEKKSEVNTEVVEDLHDSFQKNRILLNRVSDKYKTTETHQLTIMFLRTQARFFHATTKKMDFSKMSIVGRIGSEFTEHTSANNNRYLKYSIASQPRRDGQTNWYNVTVFNEPQINFLTEYVRKGYVVFLFFLFYLADCNLLTSIQHNLFSALVYVEADAANYVYERDDGSKGTTLSLVQKDINLLRNGKKIEDAEDQENTQSSE